MNLLRTYLLPAFLLLISCGLSAQVKTPKWADKARHAVVRITTYDVQDSVLQEGIAFYIDEDGTALSNLSLFKGIHSATATDCEGIVTPVELILGANDLYDVIKIRIQPSQKKGFSLKWASRKPNVGEEAVLLDYSPQKKASIVVGAVEQIAPLGGDFYYNLSMPLSGSQVSVPVLNAQGEVFGIAQPSVSSDTEKAYAMGVALGRNLTVSALSLNDKHLNSIGIPKDIPQDQEQAVAMLYIAASLPDQERYFDLLNRYVARFPESDEGYRLRAAYYTLHFEDVPHLQLAEKDMESGLKYAKEKDYAYYHNSNCMLSYVVRHDSGAYKDWSYYKCLEELQKAIDIRPQPVYYEHQSNIYSLMQEYEKAYQAIEKVNESSMASVSSFYTGSRLKRILNDSTGLSLALMDSCIAHIPQPYGREAAPYFFERGEMRVFAELFAEAVADYDMYEALSQQPPNAYFYYKREQAAMGAGMTDKALEDISKALQFLPEDAALREEYGSVLITLLRFDEAMEELDAALSKNPDRPYALRLKGYALVHLDRTEEAQAALRRSKELGDPIAAQLLTKYFKE